MVYGAWEQGKWNGNVQTGTRTGLAPLANRISESCPPLTEMGKIQTRPFRLYGVHSGLGVSRFLIPETTLMYLDYSIAVDIYTVLGE